MARRATPPFRADHVGSLLRPAALHETRAAFAAGRIDAAELTAVEDQAITDAVTLQEDAGLESATDGEFRREQWHSDFLYAIPGIRKGALGAPLPVYRKDGTISWTPNVTEITGKVHLEQPIFGDHFAFLARTVTTATPKLTVPSPSMAHFRADLSRSPYADADEFRADVAATYAAEVAALYALGCRYLQLDDTIFAFLNDPAWRANASATGLDPDHQHEINVAVINAALAAKPADMAVTVHMCRGNYRSAWFSSGGYDFVAEGVFGGLKVDGLFLEYDDERSGTFEPLRFVPEDQIVVLGVMTTKTPELESADALKRRVEEAAKYVDIDRLCISPQCGFASTVEGNSLTIDEERAKLELLVATAREIWDNGVMEPLVIAEQGHFFTGLRTHTGPAGTSVAGTHVEYQSPPSVRDNLILVHGGGGQALDMLTTPDGRAGWSTIFLRDGFAVYTVDRPGLGRSPYHPDIYGPIGPPAAYEGFVATFAAPSPPGLPEHTQWPGSGDRDDPALATFLAWQEPFPPDLVRAHEDMRDGAVGLLDRIGPSVLLTHSFGGAFGWFALSERPHLVKALVAIETAGPPFVKHPVLGDFTYGLTAVPVSYGPGSGDAKLGGIPVAVVSSPCSGFEPSCHATADYLRECGASVDELRLADLGLQGNGHAMMLEKNNAEVAAVLTDWIVKHT